MNENKLSQAEIDALMKNNEQEEILSLEEIDVLGEIGNIAMGSAATALYGMLNHKVEITTPQVRVTNLDEISKEYKRPCVVVEIEYKSGLEGINLLIIKGEDAAIIADLMMGGDGSDTVEQLEEIHLSAVAEAMNQMVGSAATSISTIIEGVVNISPPKVKYLDINQISSTKEEFFKSNEQVIDTSFQLKIGDLIDSSFKQIAPLDFTKEMASKLLKNNQALAVENESKQELAATTELKAKSTQESKYKTGKVSREDKVDVKTVQFPDFAQGATASVAQNMELIQDVPLQATVRLGKNKMTIKEVLDLGEGSIIELDKLAGEPVDLLVNGKLIAKGEVVVIDENFGFRVKDIISPMERLNNI